MTPPCAGSIAAEPGTMSYHPFPEMAVALCFGLTFALVGWWEIEGPIWRAEWIGSAEQWLNVASATLIGCAILVGGVGAFRGVHEMLRREVGVGAFRGVHEMLRREVICDDCQPSERLSPASSEDASRWRGTGDPLSASRHVEGVPLNPDDSCMRHGRDRTRRLPGRGLEHTAGVGDDSHSDRVC